MLLDRRTRWALAKALSTQSISHDILLELAGLIVRLEEVEVGMAADESTVESQSQDSTVDLEDPDQSMLPDGLVDI